MVVGSPPRPTDRHVPHPLTPRPPPPNVYSADRQGNWLWEARSPAVKGRGGNSRRTMGTTRGGGRGRGRETVKRSVVATTPDRRTGVGGGAVTTAGR